MLCNNTPRVAETKMLGNSNEHSLLPLALRSSNPWLILAHGRKNHTQTIFDPSDSSLHHRCITEMNGKRCRGSSHGWLLMVDDSSKECFLLSTSTMEVISLPPILVVPVEALGQFTLSSLPDHPGSTVVIVSDKGKFFIFCRLHDKEWTRKEVVELGDNDFFVGRAVSYQGNVYLYAASEHLVVLDVASPAIGVELLSVGEFDKLTIMGGGGCYMPSLVEAGGNLFIVVLHPRRFGGPIAHAEVARLNSSKSEWERVDNIGSDQAIFVGGIGAVACSVTDNARFEGNCIYYLDFAYDGMRLCKFKLGKQTISSQLVCPKVYKTWCRIWVLPPV